jgi:hypothetical protein
MIGTRAAGAAWPALTRFRTPFRGPLRPPHVAAIAVALFHFFLGFASAVSRKRAADTHLFARKLSLFPAYISFVALMRLDQVSRHVGSPIHGEYRRVCLGSGGTPAMNARRFMGSFVGAGACRPRSMSTYHEACWRSVRDGTQDVGLNCTVRGEPAAAAMPADARARTSGSGAPPAGCAPSAPSTDTC